MIEILVNEGLKKLPRVSIDELTVLQGELKDLTQKNYLRLKKQILKNGFISPFHIWKSDKNYILDGTQRFRTIRQMREENILIPELPYVEISAENEKEAVLILLGLASNYGTPDATGLDEMLTLAEIELDESDELFNFQGIDVMNEEKPEKKEQAPRACEKCGYIKTKAQS